MDHFKTSHICCRHWKCASSFLTVIYIYIYIYILCKYTGVWNLNSTCQFKSYTVCASCYLVYCLSKYGIITLVLKLCMMGSWKFWAGEDGGRVVGCDRCTARRHLLCRTYTIFLLLKQLIILQFLRDDIPAIMLSTVLETFTRTKRFEPLQKLRARVWIQ